MLVEQSLFFEKYGSKKNLVITLSIKHSEIIFVLLNEVIIVYILPTFIYIVGSDSKISFLGFIKIVFDIRFRL